MVCRKNCIIGLFIYLTCLSYHDCLHNQQNQTLLTCPENLEDWRISMDVLRLMGFDNIPEESSTIQYRKGSAYNYMYSLYKHVVEQSDEFDDKFHNDMSQKSDIITSFRAEQPHQGRWNRPDDVKRFWFDIGNSKEDHKLLYSELRVYTKNHSISTNFRGRYTIILSMVSRNDSDSKKKAYTVIGSVNTTTDYEGWHIFNVTDTFMYWTRHPESNHGLRLQVERINSSGRSSLMKPENIGIVGFDGSDEKQPFMAAYYKNSDNDNQIQLKVERVLKKKHEMRAYKCLDVNATDQPKLPETSEWESKNIIPCTRKPLRVNLKNLRFNRWIIAPESYDTHYCAGECNYASAHMTNHARIQSLIHSRYPERAPQPCCAPRTSSPLMVIYFPDNKKVEYKKFDNMIVNECICQ